MKGQNYRQLYESLGPQGTYEKVSSCLREGDLKPEDFSLKELFIGCCGERSFIDLGRRYGNSGGASMNNTPDIYQHGDDKTGAQFTKLEESNRWSADPGQVLQEAGEAVDLAAFSAITGQIAFNAIGKGWNNAEMIGDRIFRNYPTPFSGEKIPWLSNLFANGGIAGDQDIHPMMPYPETTLGPRWIQTPRVLKKGGILSLGMEFILFDRTAQAMQGFEKLGKAVRYTKEYQQLRVFFGYNPTGPLSTLASGQNAYTLNGTSYNTYLASGSNYVNAMTGTPLVDYTSYNQAIYLRSKILDPDTGRPITYGPPKDLFVMPFAVMNARRILTATNYQTIYPGYSASNPAAPGNVKLDSGNPVNWNINLLTSPIAYQILLGATVDPLGNAGALTSTIVNDIWVAGDFQESFWYAETFPFRTEQAMPNNIRQFEQDIQMRWKISEMGVPFTYDPRPTQLFLNSHN